MKQAEVEELVQKIMSPTLWKTSVQIESSVHTHLKRERRKDDVSMEQVGLAIQSGIKDGWIARRTRKAPRSLGNPHGSVAEYKLSGRGRPKNEPQQKISPAFAPVAV